MYGPEPAGHWTSHLQARAFQQLEPGRRYVVSVAFTDYDGDIHPVGESWTFLAYNFLPYDDGLSLFVSPDGESEWHIRMQWRAEQQGSIIDDLGRYLRPAQG